MKISELSRRSGVPLPTVKFYLRAGLLPPGERTGVNQAVYGDAHLRRLAAIRALREVGGLSIEQIADVVAAIDDPGLPVRDVLARSCDAMLTRPGSPPASPPAATAEIDALMVALGWELRPDAAARRELAETLAALRANGYPDLPAEAFIEYARLMEPLARAEIDHFLEGAATSRERAVEESVTGTVLWERVLTTLRRAAHEHFVSQAPEFTRH